MTEPLAADGRGNLLLDLRPGPESVLGDLRPVAPLPLSLVVALRDGECLLVFNRWRQEWELPGGMLEAGETAREAAAREFTEETGQPAPELDFFGTALFRLAPDDRLEHAALFLARLDVLQEFSPTDEIADLRLWDPATEITGLSPIDADIVRRLTSHA
jgi:8-oxo-dGTP diphosphatase